MTRSHPLAHPVRGALLEAAVAAALALAAVAAQAANYPVTAEQASTAQQVAQAGVPLSELAPNAPDTHTVKPGDTLWDISKLFLKSPWRWPELWGMNLEQIRNPHLIFPGQVLSLEKKDGRARLLVGQPIGGAPEVTVRLSPRVRAGALGGALSSIPLNLIEPFLNEAVIHETDELLLAPRIVATTEDQVLMSPGNLAYVRGDLGQERQYRLFREARPMLDPTSNEVLGFESTYLGTAEYLRPGEVRTAADGKSEIIPATFVVTAVRQEVGVGDRLAPVPPRQFTNYVPHAPQAPIAGQIVSIYPEGLTAGKNQIVALSRGAVDGMELGAVLELWRDGRTVADRTDSSRTQVRLPNERNGTLFVFRVFKRMSYALIMSASQPVRPGDRFAQP